MTTTTRNFLTALVAIAASTMIATPTPAHDYSSDLMCQITDTSGQVNSYSFANNSVNAAGDVGTYVETGYSSNRRGFVASQAGMRPIWIYSDNGSDFTIRSRNDPGWVIAIDNVANRGGFYNGHATLFHGQNAVGNGRCVRRAGQTPNTVGDFGNE